MFTTRSVNTPIEIINFLKSNKVKWVDLRFVDILGKEQHVTVPSHTITDDFFTQGKMFDASSLAGWKSVECSDMVLMPVLELPLIDYTEFNQDDVNQQQLPMAIMRCTVYETNGKPYDRCPRTIATRAEEYLKTLGFDYALVGPELEFFIFDNIRFKTSMNHTFYEIDDIEGAWNSATKYPEGNKGYRPPIKGGYFPIAPVDSSVFLRQKMCDTLEKMGLTIEAHHHEVATAGQNEIATKFNTLVAKCDEMLTYKYVLQNVAFKAGKTVTFMPKPLFGDNGSGMHVHFSLGKDGVNLFAGQEYAGLSKTALYFIGGILKHARALNAFTNPSTNSYKRLVPGYEAPVNLAYSQANRSAAIRIPFVTSNKAKRIEVRFGDGTANPYLAFSALLMAGLDGIKNEMDPGYAIDDNLYKLPKEQLRKIPKVCSSLETALYELEMDHQFLLEGGVFSQDFIHEFITVKEAELAKINRVPHPIEFELYYSL